MEVLSSPSLRDAYGAAGQRKVRERYTWPRIAREFRKVYERAIERPAIARR